MAHHVSTLNCAMRACAAHASGWRDCCASPDCRDATDGTGRAPPVVRRTPHPLWTWCIAHLPPLLRTDSLVADITYIPTWAGFLYLAVVLDAYSRGRPRILGE